MVKIALLVEEDNKQVIDKLVHIMFYQLHCTAHHVMKSNSQL
jgi:hypothetical protein